MHIPPLAVIIGALNLDIIIKGLPKFASDGEQVNGRKFELNPGGKGRNIAVMLAAWLEPGRVAMVSKLIRDRYGLYQIPLQSLANAKVQHDDVFLEPGHEDALPTLALFLNTINGQRANYYLPGQNESLSIEALERARPLFQQLADNQGFLLLTLEMPLQTACHALSIAEELGIRVMLDPGGQPPGNEIDYSPLLSHPIYLIKPNAEEANLLTGCLVKNITSAQRAADILMRSGIEHVLMTHGKQGAYAFTRGQGWHIPTPDLDIPPDAEATGCGDQVLAVVCAEMLHGKSFKAAAHKAVRAGSLQFCQKGLSPILPTHPFLTSPRL